MGMDDVKFSLRMRDAIAAIATRVVNELRPEERIGKVYSYDSASRTCQILFPKENVDSLVTVHCAMNMIPTEMMSTTFAAQGYAAPGNLVRVAGRPGNYYITDFVSGGPQDWLANTEVGFVKMWSGSSEPPDHLWCRGGTFPGSQYPLLASIVGDTYGTHSGDTYYLPNFNARSPVGVGGTNGKAGNVNNYSLGLKWGDERLPVHNHGVTDPGHAHIVNVGWNEQQGGHNWTFGMGTSNRNVNLFTDVWSDARTTGISIQNAGAGDMGNVHPVLGINFVVRAR